MKKSWTKKYKSQEHLDADEELIKIARLYKSWRYPAGHSTVFNIEEAFVDAVRRWEKLNNPRK